MNEYTDFEIFKKLFSRTSRMLFSYEVGTASITYLNAAFSHIWNRGRDSVIADPAILLDTVHPEDRDYLVKEYHELLSGTPKHEIEFRIILPDTSELWLLLIPLLVTDKQGKRVITGMVEDITAVKNNVADLQKHVAKKNSILEILSHDLSAPIANIQGLANALSESTESYKDAEVNKLIRIIHENSTKSLLMIREFVQQEFLESSNTEMVKRRVNLVKVVQDMMEQYKDGELLIKKNFQFNSTSETGYIYIDQNKITQVLNNLISNSIKFTHDGGVISLHLSDKEDGSLLIKVQDDGIGIPERYHEELFERFTPARREGLKGEPSTGLGMSIIKTIVEWHGGSIWFESGKNVGTTFYIEIPKE